MRSSTSTINLTNLKLSQQLSYLKEKQFNGELKITSPRNIIWRLYFCLGRLFWVDGGRAALQSWHRHLKHYFPQLDRESLAILKENHSGCDRYLILADYLEKNTIELQQVKELIQTKVEEILFDLLQQETYHSLEYSIDSNCCSSAKISYMSAKPLALIHPEEAFKKSKLVLAKWVEKGLGFWSPHLVVTIANSELNFSNIISPELVNLLDGKNSLLDIAFLTGDNLIELASSLITYVNKGILQFIEPEQLSEFEERATKIYPQEIKSPQADSDRNSSLNFNNNCQSALIVAIDNDPGKCQFLGNIVKKTGNRFISIEDSWQAVPRLISYQPDAILLAANMSIVSGYEILSQLERVDRLKNTPVILLTDNIVDCIRAKLLKNVSANISKPLDSNLLLKIIKKLLSENSSDSSDLSTPKYRGVAYDRIRAKYRSFLSSKITSKNSENKYRGISYISTTKELINVELKQNRLKNNNEEIDCPENNDLFARKYDRVTYGE
ncbi:MAG: response regulator [Prochloraceae cyanobacterium]